MKQLAEKDDEETRSVLHQLQQRGGRGCVDIFLMTRQRMWKKPTGGQVLAHCIFFSSRVLDLIIPNVSGARMSAAKPTNAVNSEFITLETKNEDIFFFVLTKWAKSMRY